jgi:hypothetical protein
VLVLLPMRLLLQLLNLANVKLENGTRLVWQQE